MKDEEVQMLLTNLDTALEEFTAFISDSEKLLEKSKVGIDTYEFFSSCY